MLKPCHADPEPTRSGMCLASLEVGIQHSPKFPDALEKKFWSYHSLLLAPYYILQIPPLRCMPYVILCLNLCFPEVKLANRPVPLVTHTPPMPLRAFGHVRRSAGQRFRHEWHVCFLLEVHWVLCNCLIARLYKHHWVKHLGRFVANLPGVLLHRLFSTGYEAWIHARHCWFDTSYLWYLFAGALVTSFYYNVNVWLHRALANTYIASSAWQVFHSGHATFTIFHHRFPRRGAIEALGFQFLHRLSL